MEQLINFISPIITYLKDSKSNVITAIIVLSLTLWFNKDQVKDYLSLEKDLTKEYFEKTYVVEKELRVLKEEISADNASVLLIHNGTVSLNKIHLMKMTMLFAVGDDASLNKSTYRNVPLSPWVDNFFVMIKTGHYLIMDAEKSEDPLVREVFKETGRRTLLYVPVMNSSNHVIGLCLITFKEKKQITESDIRTLKRYVNKIESLI